MPIKLLIQLPSLSADPAIRKLVLYSTELLRYSFKKNFIPQQISYYKKKHD